MNFTGKDWINRLELQPHPEGGYFKEIYRAEGIISQPNLPVRFSGGRAYSTAIYYLLESGDFSSMHQLDSDEQWFHIDGSALTIHSIDPKGNYIKHRIGKNHDAGELPYAVVPHGNWFGGTVDDSESFSLVGCVVAPGFDFDDFEIVKKDQLRKLYPQHTALIEKLTRS